MERVSLSPLGPEVSRIVYGAWRLVDDGADATPAAVNEKIDACLDCGITTFDHADIYGGYRCEEVFGEALAERDDWPRLRDSVELVSKCGIVLPNERRPHHRMHHYDTGREHVLASVERSLANLRTDHLDLVLIHRPDPFMDQDETAAALRELVDSGKTRHVGVSNFLPWQVALLDDRLGPGTIACNQIELSPLTTEPFLDGQIGDQEARRLRPMAWSPLAGGRLLRGEDEQAARVRSALEDVGKRHGAATADQVALAWLLAHPSGIVPVVGTNRPERIRAAAASTDLALSREEWFEIWVASLGEPIP